MEIVLLLKFTMSSDQGRHKFKLPSEPYAGYTENSIQDLSRHRKPIYTSCQSHIIKHVEWTCSQLLYP